MSPAAASPSAAGWRLEHTYAGLPALFHSRATPTPVRDPHYVVFNDVLARELGLDPEALASPEGAAIFTGNTLPEGAQPLAQAYAGHQFGHFTGLGDGRAILLGEQRTPDGRRVDVQLKGAGQTPYSRRGDGRAAVGPMLREFVISEAMHALGIPTSRSLAVVATGEPVFREEVLPGAVLTRVAASHLRVGTFEWAAAHRDTPALVALADYAMARHYPELVSERSPATAAASYLALFDAIAERQARLVAHWQLVGFIHGVMNTDNMAISGETIDYGPCAFMDTYDPETVFSSIDTGGRYAYGNQPGIAQWNLARLAEAMLPLFGDDQEAAVAQAQASLHRFRDRAHEHWLTGMRGKLGLARAEDDDDALVDALLEWMRTTRADYTNTFRLLARPDDAAGTAAGDQAFGAWHARWRERLTREPHGLDDAIALMRHSSPAIIPRNHKVEEALAAAVTRADLEPLDRLLTALRSPYDHVNVPPEYAGPAPADGGPYRTFCGT